MVKGKCMINLFLEHFPQIIIVVARLKLVFWREGTFLEVMNSGKVRFLKICLTPSGPPKGAQWAQMGSNPISTQSSPY